MFDDCRALARPVKDDASVAALDRGRATEEIALLGRAVIAAGDDHGRPGSGVVRSPEQITVQCVVRIGNRDAPGCRAEQRSGGFKRIAMAPIRRDQPRIDGRAGQESIRAAKVVGRSQIRRPRARGIPTDPAGFARRKPRWASSFHARNQSSALARGSGVRRASIRRSPRRRYCCARLLAATARRTGGS